MSNAYSYHLCIDDAISKEFEYLFEHSQTYSLLLENEDFLSFENHLFIALQHV